MSIVSLLRFFFSNADAIFDMKKGFEYLDKALLDLKLALARNLLERNFFKSVIRGIFYFIRYYVAFANPENDSKFDSKIDSLTQKDRHMGIVETIKERETQKILERGKAEVVRNLITKLGLADAQAAEVAEVSVAFVKKVRASLKKKNREILHLIP